MIVKSKRTKWHGRAMVRWAWRQMMQVKEQVREWQKGMMMWARVGKLSSSCIKRSSLSLLVKVVGGVGMVTVVEVVVIVIVGCWMLLGQES